MLVTICLSVCLLACVCVCVGVLARVCVSVCVCFSLFVLASVQQIARSNCQYAVRSQELNRVFHVTGVNIHHDATTDLHDKQFNISFS